MICICTTLWHVPYLEEEGLVVCVEDGVGRGLGGGGGGSKRRRKHWGGGRSRLESTHETRPVDQSAVTRLKVLAAKTQACQKWGFDNRGPPAARCAGCNISSLSVFVFLFVVVFFCGVRIYRHHPEWTLQLRGYGTGAQHCTGLAA